MNTILQFLLFPGLLFTAAAGLLAARHFSASSRVPLVLAGSVAQAPEHSSFRHALVEEAKRHQSIFAYLEIEPGFE